MLLPVLWFSRLINVAKIRFDVGVCSKKNCYFQKVCVNLTKTEMYELCVEIFFICLVKMISKIESAIQIHMFSIWLKIHHLTSIWNSSVSHHLKVWMDSSFPHSNLKKYLAGTMAEIRRVRNWTPKTYHASQPETHVPLMLCFTVEISVEQKYSHYK